MASAFDKVMPCDVFFVLNVPASNYLPELSMRKEEIKAAVVSAAGDGAPLIVRVNIDQRHGNHDLIPALRALHACFNAASAKPMVNRTNAHVRNRQGRLSCLQHLTAPAIDRLANRRNALPVFTR